MRDADSSASPASGRGARRKRVARQHPALREAAQDQRSSGQGGPRRAELVEKAAESGARGRQTLRVLAGEVARPARERRRPGHGVDVPPGAPALDPRLDQRDQRRPREQEHARDRQRVCEGGQVGRRHREAVQEHDRHARRAEIADHRRLEARDVDDPLLHVRPRQSIA